MTSQWEEYEPELRSGNADRINAVVEEISSFEAEPPAPRSKSFRLVGRTT